MARREATAKVLFSAKSILDRLQLRYWADSKYKLFVKALEQKGPKKYVRDEKQMAIDSEIAKVLV